MPWRMHDRDLPAAEVDPVVVLDESRRWRGLERIGIEIESLGRRAAETVPGQPALPLGRPRIGVGENRGFETMRASVRKFVSAADVVIMPMREETDDRISRERFDDRTYGSDPDARVDQQRRAPSPHEP